MTAAHRSIEVEMRFHCDDDWVTAKASRTGYGNNDTLCELRTSPRQAEAVADILADAVRREVIEVLRTGG